MTAGYPVRYHVERPLRLTRFQLLVRLVAFCAIGVMGLSFGTVFIAAYLALPVLAAVRIGSDGADAYVRDDGPKVFRALRWFAAFSAWAGLITEQLPSRTPDETVRIEVDPTAPISATPQSAMWRLLIGLPSAFALAFLCWIGTLVWIWAAFSILFVERIGPRAFHYLVGLQRWSIRLLAYQASLVDAYPPFSFSDVQAATWPTARATM